MNIVLDDAVEEKAGGEKDRLGMVVSRHRVKPYANYIWSSRSLQFDY
jgi:small nuclear ribonucleoprotein (snRNP)-like protein